MTRSTIPAALCVATLLLAPTALAQGGGGGSSNPTNAGTGTDGPAGSPAPPCLVPHVERGWRHDRARRALRRGGCSTATKRVRSSTVAAGRVVGLSEREGARLKPTRKVVIRVSSGR